MHTHHITVHSLISHHNINSNDTTTASSKGCPELPGLSHCETLVNGAKLHQHIHPASLVTSLPRPRKLVVASRSSTPPFSHGSGSSPKSGRMDESWTRDTCLPIDVTALCLGNVSWFLTNTNVMERVWATD